MEHIFRWGLLQLEFSSLNILYSQYIGLRIKINGNRRYWFTFYWLFYKNPNQGVYLKRKQSIAKSYHIRNKSQFINQWLSRQDPHQSMGVWTLVLPLSSHMPLGKLFYTPLLHFSHLYNGDDNHNTTFFRSPFKDQMN